MLFTSGYFFLLVALTFALYYAAGRKEWQIGILLVSSFVFYAWNFPVLLLLLLVSIGINILAARGVMRTRDGGRRRIIATAGVVVNLAVLAFFKYSPLIGRTLIGRTLLPEGSGLSDWLLAIPLPIGISFFTFQGISLVVDLYRGDVLAPLRPSTVGARTPVPRHQGMGPSDVSPEERGTDEPSSAALALYIAFFPQLVAGPIVKAKDFLPQIGTKRLADVAWPLVYQALVTGYFLKMVIADNLKDHTYWMKYPGYESLPKLDLAVLLFGYSVQIFADFAGYSLIAIGIARLFGYGLMDNFNFPYIARSFSEFWRRWHISLSTFLREYLYIPLGGNRKGTFYTYRNLMITMVLGGLWHGAAWSYAVWGIYHGLLLAAERWAKDRDLIWTRKPWLRRLWVFALVTLGWLLFRLPDFTQVLGYLQGMLANDWYGGVDRSLQVLIYTAPVVVYHLTHLYLDKDSAVFRGIVRPVGLGLLLFLIFTNAGSAGDFIYFQF